MIKVTIYLGLKQPSMLISVTPALLSFDLQFIKLQERELRV